eukprot:02836_2
MQCRQQPIGAFLLCWMKEQVQTVAASESEWALLWQESVLGVMKGLVWIRQPHLAGSNYPRLLGWTLLQSATASTASTLRVPRRCHPLLLKQQRQDCRFAPARWIWERRRG